MRGPGGQNVARTYDPRVEAVSGANQPVIAGSVDLGDGRVATILRAQAPLPPDAGAALAWFLEGVFGADDKPDMFVTLVAKGMLEQVARNDLAWAEVDGAVVATAWMMTPAGEPRLATLGEVYTDPAYRGHRLAPAVCRVLLERFDADGGRLIFLGTGNETAARIYESLGFEHYPRGLMRRDAAGPRLENALFAPSKVSFRPMTWGDTPRLVALYATPNPWLSACWMQGLFSATYVTHDRCNSLVKQTWQATQDGAWVGMVNEQGAIVGSGPMEPRGNQTAVAGADIDVFIHPAFQAQTGALVERMIEAAQARNWRWLRAELGEGDGPKRDLLTAAGFREVGRWTDALEIGGVRQDGRILRLDL